MDAIPIPAEWFKWYVVLSIALAIGARIFGLVRAPWAARLMSACVDLGGLFRPPVFAPPSSSTWRPPAAPLLLAFALVLGATPSCSGQAGARRAQAALDIYRFAEQVCTDEGDRPFESCLEAIETLVRPELASCAAQPDGGPPTEAGPR